MTRRRGELLHGALEMLILQSLQSCPMHGYAITEHIQRVSDEELAIDEGSMYPALYRMQRRGWLRARWGRTEKNRRAKYYSLTESGRRQLREATDRWDRFSVAVGKIMAAR